MSTRFPTYCKIHETEMIMKIDEQSIIKQKKEAVKATIAKPSPNSMSH